MYLYAFNSNRGRRAGPTTPLTLAADLAEGVCWSVRGVEPKSYLRCWPHTSALDCGMLIFIPASGIFLGSSIQVYIPGIYAPPQGRPQDKLQSPPCLAPALDAHTKPGRDMHLCTCSMTRYLSQMTCTGIYTREYSWFVTFIQQPRNYPGLLVRGASSSATILPLGVIEYG